LDGEDKEVGLEAALALPSWGRDVIPTLITVEENSDRINQIKIYNESSVSGIKRRLPSSSKN